MCIFDIYGVTSEQRQTPEFRTKTRAFLSPKIGRKLEGPKPSLYHSYIIKRINLVLGSTVNLNFPYHMI